MAIALIVTLTITITLVKHQEKRRTYSTPLISNLVETDILETITNDLTTREYQDTDEDLTPPQLTPIFETQALSLSHTAGSVDKVRQVTEAIAISEEREGSLNYSHETQKSYYPPLVLLLIHTTQESTFLHASLQWLHYHSVLMMVDHRTMMNRMTLAWRSQQEPFLRERVSPLTLVWLCMAHSSILKVSDLCLLCSGSVFVTRIIFGF